MASDWTGCKLSVADDSDHLTIQFELGPTRWTKQLAKMDGKVWCNLQEIQVLRWIAEDGDNPEATALVNSLSVKHLPRSRYPCIFPHQAAEAHQVLEIVLNMRVTPSEGLETRRSGTIACCFVQHVHQSAVAATGCASRFSDWRPRGR